MQITEVTIHPTNDGLVRAYVNIVFDNCLMIREIRVMQGPTGLFVSFPAKKQRDGSDRQLAYPANADTRMMIQRVILAEYEKVVGGGGSLPSENHSSSQLALLGSSGPHGMNRYYYLRDPTNIAERRIYETWKKGGAPI